jgi:hypothetical protein
MDLILRDFNRGIFFLYRFFTGELYICGNTQDLSRSRRNVTKYQIKT